MSSQDTTVSEFIVNELTEKKLRELEDTAQIPANQLFFTDSTDGECYNGLPLGTIIPMAIETDSIYLKRLDGGCINIYGIYRTFCDLIINSYTDNPSSVPVCDIGEYATEMETYGQCGKFVINKTGTTLYSGNYSVEGNSIKLPTITEFIASNNGGDEIGLAELDEFKSHNHTQNPHSHGVQTFPYGGSNNSYYVIAGGGPGGAVDIGTSWQGGYAVNTTATNNPTGGEETRPKNIRYPYYIVVLSSSLKPTSVKDTEIIYDMTSEDSSINWGYRSGIPHNTTITNKDFNKYKSLTCYAKGGSQMPIVSIDLMAPTSILGDGSYNGTDSAYYVSSLGDLNVSLNVSIDKTAFSLSNFSYSGTGNSDYIVYKIEGTLKDVAMIYTGDELTNGHAISINEGEISYNSSDKFVLVAGCDTGSSTQTITGGGSMHPVSCSYIEFTVPKDGAYLIMYTLVYKVNAGTSSLHLLVDTEDYTKRIANNHFSNTNPDTKVIFGRANLTKGTHVCHLVASHNQTTSSSGQVEAYTHNLCLIMEV